MTERDIQPRTVRATELYGDLWLNSEPVPVLALRGSVVLLSFWDYACCRSNLLLPYVAAWHRKYAPHGLTVVGVHTPRFTFSQEPLHVQAAVRSLRITYPVVLDNGHLIRIDQAPYVAVSAATGEALFLRTSSGYFLIGSTATSKL